LQPAQPAVKSGCNRRLQAVATAGYKVLQPVATANRVNRPQLQVAVAVGGWRLWISGCGYQPVGTPNYLSFLSSFT